MLTIFFAALLLGFVFNAAPGPVFAETLRRGLQGHYRAALYVQLGSLVGYSLWALLGLLGIGLLLQLEFLRVPLGIAGAAYLLYLAWDSWRSASQSFSLEVTACTSRTKSALRSGMLLSVTNPQNIAYWAAIGSALGSLGIANPQPADYGVYFGGFMVSSVLWCFICAGLVTLLANRLRNGWSKITYQICALMFFVLAINALRDLLDSPAAAARAANPPGLQQPMNP